MKPGDQLGGRFVLGERAGAGGMGEVFRAHDQAQGGFVALKVLHQLGGSAKERFLREVRTLSGLSHEGIVGYVAHGETGSGAPYLAMRWLDGESLETRLARTKTLTVAETLALACGIARALGYVHAQGLVHRDVKPANVFLVDGHADAPKLLDFGIARTDTAGGLTGAGVVIGTPGYMSPEQVRGEGDVDARTDVFALGCVLYECLTGTVAFDGPTPFALLVKILVEEPVPAGSLVALPPALGALLDRMLAKERGPRPVDGDESARALTELLEEAPGYAARGSFTMPPPSLTRSAMQLVSVVLARGTPQESERVLPEVPTVDASTTDVHWLARLQQLGARLERLADGATALFLSGESSATDLAARAARAALVLRGALPGATIAVATGRAETRGRLPVGEAIDRAAQLVAKSDRAVIRLDDVTSGLLDARFEVESDAEGLLLGGERETQDAPRRLLGRPAPLVGRAADLRALQGIFEACAADSVAHAVVVTAAAGVGKSRLRQELLAWAEALPEPPAIWTARGDPSGAGAPLGLLRQALRGALGLRRGEELALQRQRLLARASSVREVWPDLSVFLGELAGAPFADEKCEPLRAARRDAPAMADQLRRAFVTLVGAELSERPLVLVLDDLQWGDAASVAFVDAALRTHRDAPFMVLGLGRPEVAALFPDLWKGRGVQHIELRELSPRACKRLVHEVLGADVSPESVDRIVKQSLGNAFYLEELVRAVSSGRGNALPGTVTAMVQARLDSLDEETRRLLRAASVFGANFEERALAELLDVSAATVAERLRALIELEIVVPMDRAYAFRHDVLRDVAYGSLTGDDRALGHCLAAAWLERTESGDPAQIAEHHERGGQPSRAVAGWVRAAYLALAANDLVAAVTWAERGIACGAEGESLGTLWLTKAEASFWRGDYELSSGLAAQAMSHLSRASVPWAEAAALLVASAANLGRRELAVETGEKLAVAVAGDVSAPVLAAAARAVPHLYFLGDRATAVTLLDRVRSLATVGGFGDATLMGRLAEAEAVRAHIGGDAGGLAEREESALVAYERAGLTRPAQTARMNAAVARLALGQYAEAIAMLRATIADSARLELPGLRATALQNLGWCLMSVGQLEEARACEYEAVTALVGHADRRVEGVCYTCLANIALRSGDAQTAEFEAHAAADALVSFPLMRVHALATRAEALRALGRAEEALEAAREAMATIEVDGAESGEALARLVQAELLHDAGDVAGARNALARARARLLELASKIENASWRASFLERVPEHARTLALARDWGV